LNNDEYTIGEKAYDFNVKMYYDLDTNEINSDGVNYPIDQSIGFIPNKESLSTPNIRVEEKVSKIENNSMTFISNRIKGLKIALKVARAENKPKIQKRIKGLEIAQKMQPKKMNKGGVVFTNYNGSEIMYEPNYDEYFVNDEVFDSMEDAKNYIDTGEMENEKYGFGGGLLVGSLVGGYLGYKVGKYNKQVVSSGFQTEKLIGKDIKNKLQGKKTYAKGGGVAETMHFFVVIDKNDKNYNRVGYVFDETETIFDKDGNEFEKLNFENQKVAKKYNVKDLIYLEKRNTFTQKDKYGDNDIEYVILVNYQYSSKPFDFYYYLYNVTKKLVATEGNLDWVKSNLPKGFKLNTSYGEGGGVDTISDEDLLRIKLAVAEAQDRINANQNESESGGIDGITKFIKENPQVLLMLEKGGSVGDENYEMLKNKVTELLHHSKELQAVVKKKPKTPAWVISKSSRASTDLSDITHYLEGKL
jgi:hypothetical protein